MSQSQVQNLCQILVESNLQLCESIKENGFDVQNLYNHFKWTAKKISKLNEKTRIYQKTGYLYDKNAEKINKRNRKM